MLKLNAFDPARNALRTMYRGQVTWKEWLHPDLCEMKISKDFQTFQD